MRAYASDLKEFVKWARSTQNRAELPVTETLCMGWLTHMEVNGLALGTIFRRARGLCHHHRAAGMASPTDSPKVRRLLRGIKDYREAQGEFPRGKRALTIEMVRSALNRLSVRDRAIVLLGMSTGMRRSELAALQWMDITRTAHGLEVYIRRSKEDQLGRGRSAHVASCAGVLCPASALIALRRRREQDGPVSPDAAVFGCGARTIARVIKRVAELAGEDPKDFGAHSARAGMITVAAEAGVSTIGIMRQSGHRSLAGVRCYVRPGQDSPLDRVASGAVARMLAE